MPAVLSCYYLDEPLAEEERPFVERALLGHWAKFKTGATTLIEKRVPLVLPTPDAQGLYADTPEQRAAKVRANLRHAGIHADIGRQVAWIMPQDGDWDAVFQFAIREETGYAPFVVQRWYREHEQIVRGPVRVVDTQMLLSGLE